MPFARKDNLIDLQIVVEIQLDSIIVLKHLEADGVLAANKFLLRVDANVEMIEKQIIISAIPAVFTAQDIGVSWRRWCLWWSKRDSSLC